MTNTLTIGERVAWYRRRRGMSQEVLAGLVGRTVDWLSKVENNRIDLDRLSVIKSLADALDVALADLVAEPSLMQWTGDSGTRTVPALRAALMNYRNVTPFGASASTVEPPSVVAIKQELATLWDAFQAARFAYVTSRLPSLIAHVEAAVNSYSGHDLDEARRVLSLAYQSATVQLTKIGEADLAWIAADRGLGAARAAGDTVLTCALLRSVTHALQATGRFKEAVQLTNDAANYLEPQFGDPSPEMLSVYGTLLLAGSMAAARANDAITTRTFLRAADEAATRLGRDANHLWTAFGPTNVAIHRVATAAELGDVQVAIDLGPQVDTTGMPMERQVRHTLELARAYSARNRANDALNLLLHAERMAPEQVQYHRMSRQLVLTWIRQQRNNPSTVLVDLARRLDVME
ncbi:helix-turn-helix transcriptional regulator [Dactylosporangium sp. AC04546]|uniref:helix-turn-helix domain-containing protein n=1 Tax=Dactylosporangium sp. AC04546 TaxID=2862460 RepID=UPI001EDDAA6F|nr:helix-turn-helix transcriptional regulator [Dactylosporangium sp. AC04546]WVK84645.1 helix-turn-helix transcriptional regulator [Dactylosporangium sp. AC04546]